jgi:hypothetical protein
VTPSVAALIGGAMRVGFQRLTPLICVLAVVFVSLGAELQQKLQLPDGPYVHKATEFGFPVKAGAFTRTTGTNYDGKEGDVGISYHERDPHAWADVYVYPCAGETLVQEMDNVEASLPMMAEYKNPKTLEKKPFTFDQNGKRYQGLHAVFTYDIVAEGKPDMPTKSQAFVLTFKEHFLKFRISYHQADANEVEKTIDEFMHAFTILPDAK